MIRLVVCVDVDTENLEDAYAAVYRAMDRAELDWESSDEWYDGDGMGGDPEELQIARMKVYAKEVKQA